MAFSSSQEENIAAYGGYGGGMGGSWCIIIVFFVIAWLLFRDGHRDGVDGHRGFGFGDGCGPCVQPAFKDESNFEEERNLKADYCNKTEKILESEASTRALIEQNYIQDLRDRLTEKNSEVMMLKSEMFSEKKFDQVLGAIGRTDREIECLKCELPKRPPVFAECVTPNTHDIDCDDRHFRREFPRRGRCDFDDCCFA